MELQTVFSMTDVVDWFYRVLRISSLGMQRRLITKVRSGKS